jgi:methionyl-tRNA formyltransferase
MQIKIAFFLNGIRGKQIQDFVNKKKIKIDLIFNQKNIIKNNKLNFDLIKKKIKLNNNYIFIFIGFNKIINRNVINYPKFGSYNLHAGYLPKYRGASPIVYQLLNNENKGACYILKMDSGIDNGPYVLKKNYKITDKDDATSLTQKTGDIFCGLLLKFFKLLKKNNKIKLNKQTNKTAFYWTKRYPRDGLINWSSSPAKVILSTVKALRRPYPGAFAYLKKRKIIIDEAIIGPFNLKGVSGRVVRFTEDTFTVICNEGSVTVKKLRNYEIKNLIKNKIIKYGSDFK